MQLLFSMKPIQISIELPILRNQWLIHITDAESEALDQGLTNDLTLFNIFQCTK